MTVEQIHSALKSDREFRTETIVRNNYPDVLTNLEAKGYSAISSEDQAIDAILSLYHAGRTREAERMLSVPWIPNVSGEKFDKAVRRILPSDQQGDDKIRTLSGGDSGGGGGGMGGGLWGTIVKFTGEAFEAGARYESINEGGTTTDMDRGAGGKNYTVTIAIVVGVAIAILITLYFIYK